MITTTAPIRLQFVSIKPGETLVEWMLRYLAVNDPVPMQIPRRPPAEPRRRIVA